MDSKRYIATKYKGAQINEWNQDLYPLVNRVIVGRVTLGYGENRSVDS